MNNKQLGYRFRRQQGIGNYIADFYCSELKLVIEVDADNHTNPEIYQKDRRRDAYMIKLGFIVKRYYSNEVFENLEGMVLDILEVCDKIKREAPTPALPEGNKF